MNLIWTDFKMRIDENEADLPYLMARKMKVPPERIKDLHILRKAVDARKKPQIYFVYTLEFELDASWPEIRRAMARIPQLKENPGEQEYKIAAKPAKKLVTRPVVVGTGPAGYFAALALAREGYRPLVLERGDSVEERAKRVQRFWETGNLDPESNVQFGEGGAGTFSDGKLTTRIHDRRVREVLESFVEFGAAKEILYLAKPHIGTDVLKNVVRRMREKIEFFGGEVRFRTKVTGFAIRSGRLCGLEINKNEIIPAEAVILAVGHSARDIYEVLNNLGVALEQKAFAVGLRVEHSQEFIDIAQYGIKNHPNLGAADYHLTYKDRITGRGAYTFCMCPGGKVIASSSEPEGVVTNGMSEYARDSGTANSAVVVTVDTGDFPSRHPLAGVEFQRYWEKRAFLAGGKNYYAPVQTVQDFLQNRVSEKFYLQPTYMPGAVPVNLRTVLPQELGEVLARAFIYFNSKIRGFAGKEATLTGVETRTSAPVRILRDESGQSLTLKGLFPAGEGAGYAGGIMSSAVDGLRSAEKLMAQYAPKD